MVVRESAFLEIGGHGILFNDEAQCKMFLLEIHQQRKDFLDMANLAFRLRNYKGVTFSYNSIGWIIYSMY